MDLNHKGTVTLNTDRLILKKEEEQGLDKIWDYLLSDKEAVKICGFKPFESKEEYIEFNKKVQFTDKTYAWSIWLKENDIPIGSIGVHTINEEDLSCELGYNMHPSYWNNGYMTEALKKVTEFLIKEVGFNRVVCKYKEGNIASKRVMEKANYTYEGCERQTRYRDNKFINLYCYSFIKDDLK